MANQNQPGKFDAVLGGQAPPPVAGVILGGLEGVKSRLLSSVIEVQVAALSDTLYYRDAGLDLVIEALPDISGEVLSYAARLLREQGGLKGKQALLEHNPWLFFTTLKDWQAEIFHPQIGIKNSSGIAYIVSFSQLQLLLQDPQAGNVEALICHLYDYNYDYTVSEEFYNFVEILFESRKRLTGLKALFLGDRITHNYRKSHFGLGDISLVLEGYPQLEVLHIRGCCNDLECSKIQHNNLKTLIIETANISDLAIYQICSLHLPALEYFELWMGRSGEHQSHETIDSLKPILFGESLLIWAACSASWIPKGKIVIELRNVSINGWILTARCGLIANPYFTSITVKDEIKTSQGELDFNRFRVFSSPLTKSLTTQVSSK